MPDQLKVVLEHDRGGGRPVNPDDIPAGSLCVVDTNVLIYAEQGISAQEQRLSAALREQGTESDLTADSVARACPQINARRGHDARADFGRESRGASGRQT